MSKYKHYSIQLSKLFIGFFVAASLLLWGWNSSMPELFDLPPILFKQAGGLIILLCTISFTLGSRNTGWSRFNSGPCLNSVGGEQS